MPPSGGRAVVKPSVATLKALYQTGSTGKFGVGGLGRGKYGIAPISRTRRPTPLTIPVAVWLGTSCQGRGILDHCLARHYH